MGIGGWEYRKLGKWGKKVPFEIERVCGVGDKKHPAVQISKKSGDSWGKEISES
jgi:hypothetical protein